MSNYTVTDKAELNMLLFKVGLDHLSTDIAEKYAKYNNMVFLIDTNWKVYTTNIKTQFTASSHLFNGEYLIKDKNNNILNKFAVFDTYILNGEDVCNLELMSIDETKNTRIRYAIDYFKNGDYISENNNVSDFMCCKDFKGSNGK